ncbi:MAG: hypothetical protein Ct9H90mP3_3670 [Flammeovirgaceae bacterium]|nr:MAG: hypothetical protein Ct9H90mP3_3670 [Flammeovirgaceae bacterium]
MTLVRAPKKKSDTVTILEKVGHFLDEENNRIYNKYSDSLSKKDISLKIEEELDVCNIFKIHLKILMEDMH